MILSAFTSINGLRNSGPMAYLNYESTADGRGLANLAQGDSDFQLIPAVLLADWACCQWHSITATIMSSLIATSKRKRLRFGVQVFSSTWAVDGILPR